MQPLPAKSNPAVALSIAQVVAEHALNVRKNLRIHCVMKPVAPVVEPLSRPEKTAGITADLCSSLEKSYRGFSRPTKLVSGAAPGGTAAENHNMRPSGHRSAFIELHNGDPAKGCF